MSSVCCCNALFVVSYKCLRSSLTGEDYELEMVADAGLTYEQLRSIIDSLLIESGYYQCQQQSSSVSSVSAVR
jgi:hypothetical protein